MRHIPMPIISARLSLNPLSMKDSADLFVARRESYAELAPWGTLIWSSLDGMTIDENDQFCCRKMEQFVTDADITIVARDLQSGRLIGGGGLHQCDWDNLTFSLGYWVRTSETGQGYATEIATALTSYAFNQLAAQKITSFHGDGNSKSQKILEKIGFQHVSQSKGSYKLLDGSMIDSHHYHLLNPSP